MAMSPDFSLSLTPQIGNWLGVLGTDYLHHSFPGTLGAGDSLVALQPPHWDLLISHLITTGDWDKHCI